MSRSFVKVLKLFFKSIDNPLKKLNKEIDEFGSFIIGGLLVGTTIGHGVYALGTVENKIIKINKKYQFDRNGFTEFMVIDENGKHYNVNNSIWYWKWNSLEDWHKLETNKHICVKYYGLRIPVFGMFPNIIMINSDRNKEISIKENINLEFNKNNNNLVIPF